MLKVFYIRVQQEDFPVVLSDRTRKRVSEEAFRAAMAFKSEKARFTRLVGELLVSFFMRRCFGVERDCFSVMRAEGGKPYIVGVKNVFYNISHSGDYIVCAVSDEEVGIDVERRAVARMPVARRFFCSLEIERLDALEGVERDELFFNYWSVKECFLKYTGSGLSRSLSSFFVDFSDCPIIYEQQQAVPVCVRECPIDRGYACYVCSSRDVVPELIPVSPDELFV